MKVLLIDDTPTLARVTGYAFRSLGCEVEIAHSGDAARQILAARDFDVLFIDVNLGGESGFDLLAALRASDNRIPAVMFTAQALDEVAAQVAGCGAVGCLTKPFTLPQLQAKLDEVGKTGRG